MLIAANCVLNSSLPKNVCVGATLPVKRPVTVTELPLTAKETAYTDLLVLPQMNSSAGMNEYAIRSN